MAKGVACGIAGTIFVGFVALSVVTKVTGAKIYITNASGKTDSILDAKTVQKIYELKAYTQDEAMKMLKWERRIEFGMESSRFFDLVRWGEAKDVINAYYVTEAARCSIYKNAGFTENKNEYLPIPFEQISASNGNYTQNFGW